MPDKIHRNSLKPGHKIHWYEIKEILGQGGFGITYLAYDPNLTKYVAIKEYLPIELAVRERDHSVHPVSEDRGKQYKWGLDRFISEARTLAQFNHPNIVRVLSVTEENNTAYMVMAYERGQSLQKKLEGKKTLEESELIKILIPIMGGLEQVHKAGFIHRDIKPDNIFIRNDGSPVLLDFGSARQALGEQTKTLTSLVSPGYAPYEQYYSKSNEQGPWTDIYGLGATIYRAIAGIPPMDAVDRSKTILRTSTDPLVKAQEIGNEKYSKRFLTAVDHALQFKQEDRPQTINEWKKEFDLPDDPIKEAIVIDKKTTQQGQQKIYQFGRTAKFNLRRGILRLWLFFTICWTGFFGLDAYTQLEYVNFIPEKQFNIALVKAAEKYKENLENNIIDLERTTNSKCYIVDYSLPIPKNVGFWVRANWEIDKRGLEPYSADYDNNLWIRCQGVKIQINKAAPNIILKNVEKYASELSNLDRNNKSQRRIKLISNIFLIPFVILPLLLLIVIGIWKVISWIKHGFTYSR